jgi:hypothetical protein
VRRSRHLAGPTAIWRHRVSNATHYFHTALDLSVCVENAAGRFYLLTLKGSQQELLRRHGAVEGDALLTI